MRLVYFAGTHHLHKYVLLLSGRLVLSKLGLDVDVYFASEIDENAILVARVRHENTVQQIGDVRTITKKTVSNYYYPICSLCSLTVGCLTDHDFVDVKKRVGLYARLFWHFRTDQHQVSHGRSNLST